MAGITTFHNAYIAGLVGNDGSITFVIFIADSIQGADDQAADLWGDGDDWMGWTVQELSEVEVIK